MKERYLPVSLIMLLIWTFQGCQTLKNQGDKPVLMENTYTFFQMDQLGHFYRVDNYSTLVKFDLGGRELFDFSRRDLGKITSVDVSDPYKTLVFYRDQQQLVVLDNTLYVLAMMDLSQLEGKYIQQAATSEDGHYWLFDLYGQVLLKIDSNLHIIEESFPLYQEGIDDYKPENLSVQNGSLLVGDPYKGILLFDHFGTYKKHIPIYNFSFAILIDQFIYYVKGKDLIRYDLDLFDEQVLFDLSQQPGRNFHFDRIGCHLSVFDQDSKRVSYQNCK